MATQAPVPQLTPKQRRRTIAMPLVIAFVLTLFFHGLGGGHGQPDTAVTTPGVQGVNMTLPPPGTDKDKALDKPGFYQKASIDSARLAESRKADPYFVTRDTVHPINSTGMMTLSKTDADRKADELLQQVEQMKEALAARQVTASFKDPIANAIPPGPFPRSIPEIQTPTPELPPTSYRSRPSGDPELDRIDGVLEKLIRVQHPDLIKTDTPIRTEPPLLVTIAADEGEREPGFVDITDNSSRDFLHENALPAEISSDQTITAGSSVELRLTQPVKIEGYAVPKNQLLRGIASLNGERLIISINSIRIGQTILPVALQAYDLDGLAGIRIPGAIIRDASKESADQAINSVAAASVDPSLGAQAANAGVQFARSLATKKVRLVQVAVPAGYQVLLKNIRR
jgi:hypothetical protein